MTGLSLNAAKFVVDVLVAAEALGGCPDVKLAAFLEVDVLVGNREVEG